MEGVGARLGRSSTRYVPATVFTGPVRKWKKKWIHAPSSPNHHAAANRAVNGASHLIFYKWTPITSSLNSQSYNNNNGTNGGYNRIADSTSSCREETAAAEEPMKKKFKYIPIIVLEEQKNESSEADTIETGTSITAATSKSDGRDEKPEISYVTIDESQAPESNPVEQHDLNESTLDFGLGLNGEDDDDRVKANLLE